MMRPVTESGLLRENERLDDLQNGYYVIQDPDKFCFGMDAVLLSDFAAVKKGERVLDMCTGTGVIPILLAAKTEGLSFTGLEIMEDCAEMASRSVKLNGLMDRVSVRCGDVREASALFGQKSFHVVTCNPPYMAKGEGLQNPGDALCIARHEILCSLEDVLREAGRVLVDGGRFYMVHRPRRLAEVMDAMRAFHLEPKSLRMVYPFADREANLFLIEGRKGGKPFMAVKPPLIVYEKPGKYTGEIFRIYGMPDAN